MVFPLTALAVRVKLELGLPESEIEFTVWPFPTETYTTIRSPFWKNRELVVSVVELLPAIGTAATKAIEGLVWTLTDMMIE